MKRRWAIAILPVAALVALIVWLPAIAIGLGIALLVLLLWGFLVEPRLIGIEREDAVIPNLPPAWQGRQIAVIADFQVGMWGANLGTSRRIVKTIVDMKPAAVLLAGDFLYKASSNLAHNIAIAIDIVRPLTAAGLPTYAVLGNHDYEMDKKDHPPNLEMIRQLCDALGEAGVVVLQNDAVQLPLPDADDANTDTLYLVGIGANWPGHDDVHAALRNVPAHAPRLVMMHNPNTFAKLPAHSAPVAVAAHTHGGQLRIPFTPDWSWLTFVKDDDVHAAGWFGEDYGQPGNCLYVNRGIGFSDVPIRINCSPELTVFTLRT